MALILNTEEAAAKLRVKPLTIRKYLKAGLLPGRKLGKSWRIVETDLENFISTGTGAHLPSVKSTPVERISLRGYLKNSPGSFEDFLQSKREEVEIEEAKFIHEDGE